MLAHPGEVRETLDEFFAKQPRSHWLERLEAAGVWCTPVNTLDEVLVDEQVRANEYLSTLDDGLRTVAMPFTLAGYQAPVRAARRPGEDDDEVLLGLVSPWGSSGLLVGTNVLAVLNGPRESVGAVGWVRHRRHFPGSSRLPPKTCLSR